MKFLLAAVLSAFALSAFAAEQVHFLNSHLERFSDQINCRIAPNSAVKVQLNGTGLCVAGTGTTVGSQLTLQPCASALTVFNLPRGAPTTPTQLALNDTLSSGGTARCISANGVATFGPLFLDNCQDDQFQRWTVSIEDWTVEGVSGKGTIVNAGSGKGTDCLTAADNAEGSYILFDSCSGRTTQEWATTVVDN
ncbi:hypothetical protein PENSPDRAFT_663343 [Peniophora sp. CONT]|nr:hypothetical protein PENSPDRAFT_663343 [Peniophora sp. CONT]